MLKLHAAVFSGGLAAAQPGLELALTWDSGCAGADMKVFLWEIAILHDLK